MMKIDLPDNVISIQQFLADRTLKAMKGECPHNRLGIDPLDGLYCLDCKRQLNAVEWIIQQMENWRRINARAKEVKRQEEELAKRTRSKCVHCGKMTPVRL